MTDSKPEGIENTQYILGGMAVSCGLLTQEQYEACYFEHVSNFSHIPFEEYLVAQNVLTGEQIVYLRNATGMINAPAVDDLVGATIQSDPGPDTAFGDTIQAPAGGDEAFGVTIQAPVPDSDVTDDMVRAGAERTFKDRIPAPLHTDQIIGCAPPAGVPTLGRPKTRRPGRGTSGTGMRSGPMAAAAEAGARSTSMRS